jgi:[acyl-carrier-protein] S-malonyltransferase
VFGDLVSATPLSDPVFPVVANGSAQPMTATDEIVAELSAQMASPVNWTGSVQTMAQAGIKTIIELGPGAVLAGLIKRIDREIVVLSASDIDPALPSGAK